MGQMFIGHYRRNRVFRAAETGQDQRSN